MGQLVSKQVGGTDITTFLGLQKVDYQYNIRGWLTQINNIDDLNDANGPRDLFSFKINYDNPDLSEGETTAGLYNGNIAQTLWHSDNDDIIRKYGYAYDALNRLTNATFFKDNTLYNSFDETLSYDKNGNIMSLLRTGYLESQYVVPVIDNLTYDYAADSNLLKGVEDSTGSPIGFNDTNASIVDYTYDANGNMISDANKDITGISYNHLNLPTHIYFGSGNKIRYIYNAAGVKLRKDVLENNTHTITDYLAGHQYRDGKLGFFTHAEGYVNVHYCSNCTLEAQQAPKFNYVFQYRDHLGNIRMNYGFDEAEQVVKIMEEDHYYPFGLKHMNYNRDKGKYEEEELQTLSKIAPVLPTEVMAYKYKYNGKEYQDELGLNMYDYGARNYEPAIGRWMNVDPKVEQYRRWSPYNYCVNNPMRFTDPDGMGVLDWVKNKTTGVVTWNPTATTPATTPAGYDYVGKEYNGLSIKSYNAYSSGGLAGVEIEASYNDGKTGTAMNAQFQQTVTTNLPLNGATSPYNDPYPEDDNKPFYYTDAELPGQQGNGGNDLDFYDRPTRLASANGTTWEGELTLATDNGQGFTPVITITYGFEIKGGVSTPNDIKVSPTESAFQKQTLDNYNATLIGPRKPDGTF